jgi:exoribonuclease R
MYKFTTEDNTYSNYKIIDSLSQETITNNTINPFELKLFHNDTFNLPNVIVYSYVRLNKYNAGILVLNKTYGKEGKKFLYLCIPDNKQLPHFLIPYSIPINFDKSNYNLYITFEYKHWDNKYPHGIITQNFGNVNNPLHYYEYLMYCKNLNVSIHSFTQQANSCIDKNEHIIDEIIEKYNINYRNDKVFTIDANNSIDLDDGISIKNDIISIYISNVPIIIDYLKLWDSFTNRISNIYLPHKKYNMLPTILGQLCSLNKNTKRICFIMDYNVVTEETHISIGYVKIKHNYFYNDETIENNEDYKKIKELYPYKNSSQIISSLMIKCNTVCADYMKKYKNGIYKSISNNEIISDSNYNNYNDVNNYLHITSPIRRLVDILNMYKLCENKEMFKFTNDASTFYLNWIEKIEYINTVNKKIRKVQSNCNILNACLLNNHGLYKGTIFDKEITHDNKYKYQVYLNNLKVYSKIIHNTELLETEEYTFKLYVFQNEISLKKKIKLEIII